MGRQQSLAAEVTDTNGSSAEGKRRAAPRRLCNLLQISPPLQTGPTDHPTPTHPILYGAVRWTHMVANVPGERRRPAGHSSLSSAAESERLRCGLYLDQRRRIASWARRLFPQANIGGGSIIRFLLKRFGLSFFFFSLVLLFFWSNSDPTFFLILRAGRLQCVDPPPCLLKYSRRRGEGVQLSHRFIFPRLSVSLSPPLLCL